MKGDTVIVKPFFCVNCSHFIPETHVSDPDTKYARCAATKTYNLVTGEIIYSFCSVERESELRCGKTAVNYEPKYKDQDFVNCENPWLDH